MTIKEITENLEQASSLKQIAESYSEIANQKIKRIRAEVERNRQFFQEISFVYELIRSLAAKKKLVVVKPKKSVSIILTSNYRFYGQINADLIKFFVKSTQNLETDKVIIGKAVIEYFTTNHIKVMQQVLLKTDQPDTKELANLVNIIKDYSQANVYFSKLKSLLVQVPSVVDLNASAKIEENPSKKIDFKFIFEPELFKILQFFDNQILTLLLEETFLESEVSRTASRFISMDQAETEANKIIKEYEKLKAYTLRNIKNSQILESLAAVTTSRKKVNYG